MGVVILFVVAWFVVLVVGALVYRLRNDFKLDKWIDRYTHLANRSKFSEADWTKLLESAKGIYGPNDRVVGVCVAHARETMSRLRDRANNSADLLK